MSNEIVTPAMDCLTILMAHLRKNIARASLHWMVEARINDRLNRADEAYNEAYRAAQIGDEKAYSEALARTEASYNEAYMMFWTRPAV